MGSRLTLKLSDLIIEPKVSVTMSQMKMSEEDTDEEYEPVAVVHFGSKNPVSYTFDYYSNKGEVNLSCDFNFFRYEDGCIQLQMLRCLYELGISFSVSH